MALSDIRPTTRRRVSRATSYVVALLVVGLLAALIDWPRFSRQFLNPAAAWKVFPDIVIVALRNTLLYTVISFTVGTALAVVLALMKMSSGPAKWYAVAHIELFRGLPALLTIFACAFMIPIGLGVQVPGGTMGAGLIGLILVTSAYNAEVIRSGIEAVPKGQREAARSLGMSQLSTMFSIILPQGLRIVIPPLTNEVVMLLKDVSLLYIAGVTADEKDLTTFVRDFSNHEGNSTPLVVGAILYLIVTVPLTYLVGRLEKKMAVKR
jgi:polar amino acid transport system permease protein